MRPTLLVGILLLSGCLGPAAPTEPTAIPAAVEPALRLLITDDELVPIPGAIVFLDNELKPLLGNEIGEVFLDDLGLGLHQARVWAPSYYGSAYNFSFGPNSAGTTLNIILTKRPDDRVFVQPVIIAGQCFLAMRSGHDAAKMGCMAKPNSGPRGPPPSFRLPLTNRTEDGIQLLFEEARLEFRWGAAPMEQLPVLEARLEPNGAFADGRSVITFEGRGPYEFQIHRSQLDPTLVDGKHWIRFGPAPADDGQPRVLFSVDFHINGTTGTRHVAPPNPAWPR